MGERLSSLIRLYNGVVTPPAGRTVFAVVEKADTRAEAVAANGTLPPSPDMGALCRLSRTARVHGAFLTARVSGDTGVRPPLVVGHVRVSTGTWELGVAASEVEGPRLFPFRLAAGPILIPAYIRLAPGRPIPRELSIPALVASATGPAPFRPPLRPSRPPVRPPLLLAVTDDGVRILRPPDRAGQAAPLTFQGQEIP